MHLSTETQGQAGPDAVWQAAGQPCPHRSQSMAGALSLWQYTRKTGDPCMAIGSECGVTTHVTHLHQLLLNWDN